MKESFKVCFFYVVVNFLLILNSQKTFAIESSSMINPAITDKDDEYWKDIMPGEVIIGYDNTINVYRASSVELNIAGKGVNLLQKNLSSLNSVLVKVSENLDEMKEFIRVMKTKPHVRYAEPNKKIELFGSKFTPDDPYFPSEQWDKLKLNCPAAWDICLGDTTISVGIIGMGSQYTHPDLADRYGVVKGYDFRDGDSDPIINGAGEYHGTHCSSVAASTISNGLGISGVANVRLYSLRCSDSVSMTLNDCCNAIAWCAAHPVNIISMSFGSTVHYTSMENACQNAWNAGCFLCAAAGNNATSPPMYPANYSSVVAVSSIDTNDALSNYSNYGPAIELAAPGGGIYAAYPMDTYKRLYGTSMACPQVAGCAALVWSVNHSLTNAQVRAVLDSTAYHLGSAGRNEQFGYGRPDVFAAMNIAGPKPVQITSPRGGEIWAGGSVHPVTWTAFGSEFASYRLLYSTDGGVTYPDTIAKDISPDNSMRDWTLPLITSFTCRVKIQRIDSSGNIIFEHVSNSNFTIDSDTPSVFGLSFPANNIWTTDTLITFGWDTAFDSSSGIRKYQLWINDTIRIDSIRASGALTCNMVLKDGDYNWFIRAYDNAGNYRNSESAWNFKIDILPPAYFSLISPLDSECVKSDSVPSFMWHSAVDAGIGGVKYQLWINNSPDIVGLVDTFVTLSSPLTTGVRHWFIRAIDSLGHSRKSTETRVLIVDSLFDTLAPLTPKSLLANGYNPSIPTGDSIFSISYAEADSQTKGIKTRNANKNLEISVKPLSLHKSKGDTSNIALAFYKLGNRPVSNYDTIGTADTNPFDVKCSITGGETLWVWLKDFAGNLDYNNRAYVILNYVIIGVDGDDIPDKFILFAPAPIPSVKDIKIKYGLPERSAVTLGIYDLSGRLVRTLFSGTQEKGYHTVSIVEAEFVRGVYFIKFYAGKYKETRKLVLMR